MEISAFHFVTSMIQEGGGGGGGGHFSKFSIHFYRTYERGVENIDIVMAYDKSIYCVFPN